MSHPSIEHLKNEGFLADFGVIANPRALHSALERSDAVRDIRNALSTGEITEETIGRFVSEILAALRVGRLFPYDVSLATIAVAVETRPTDFADELLLDLARLERSELPMAIRVARKATQVQSRIAGNKSSVVNLASADEMPCEWQEAPRFIELAVSEIEECFEYGAS